MSEEVHDAARRGFGEAAAEYDAIRPDYPESAIDRMAQELELGPGASVLDLGAGTGKLTRLLAATGAGLVALEPVEGMWRTLVRMVPDVPVAAGVAEALPFAGASFDAAVAGQAFHWFRGEAALGEIARVLRPAGRMGLIWNNPDESVGWVGDLMRMLERYERGTPRERTGEWRRAFSASDDFGTLHQRRFAHQQWLDREGFVARIASTSFVRTLPPGEREEVLGRLRDLAEEVAGPAGRIVLPYHTELYWCAGPERPRRLATRPPNPPGAAEYAFLGIVRRSRSAIVC
ncbi:MAG: class I SAM-dependent methyltransferase [Actinomycetota bacterium]